MKLAKDVFEWVKRILIIFFSSIVLCSQLSLDSNDSDQFTYSTIRWFIRLWKDTLKQNHAWQIDAAKWCYSYVINAILFHLNTWILFITISVRCLVLFFIGSAFIFFFQKKKDLNYEFQWKYISCKINTYDCTSTIFFCTTSYTSNITPSSIVNGIGFDS